MKTHRPPFFALQARLTAALCFLLLSISAAKADAGLLAKDLFSFAEDRYAAGDYLAAARAGQELETAPGLALAARALLAHATSTAPVDERLGFIDQAEAFAREALVKDETYVEGHLQLVVALGHRGKSQGVMASQFEGLVSVTRRHIDRALELEPDNPWALAISGGWHMELARRDPIGITAIIYGARRSTGMEEFERALSLDPGNAILQVQYGLTLLETRRNKYKARAREALEAAKGLMPNLAYEKTVRQRGLHVLSLLDGGDRRALITAVRNYNSLNLDNIMPDESAG